MHSDNILKRLKAVNPQTRITPVSDPSFGRYGRVLAQDSFNSLCELANRTTEALDHNVYVADVSEFHLPDAEKAASSVFGGMPIEIGYCNGMNRTMNGLEYHKSPEVTVAVTDLVLFLCLSEDLIDFDTVDSSSAEAFLFPKGTAFALFPGVLHLAPCCVFSSGFKAIIILPLGTNTNLPSSFIADTDDKEARLLFKTNKWMIAHRDRTQLTSQGVHVGLLGENRLLNPIS